jgi:hypothetical protein
MTKNLEAGAPNQSEGQAVRWETLKSSRTRRAEAMQLETLASQLVDHEILREG